MKRLLVLLTILAIAGCAATSVAHKKYGRKGLHINCSGLTSSWQKCDEEAATACGLAGYKVMAKSGVGEGDYAENYPFGLNPDGFSSRNMIVICR